VVLKRKRVKTVFRLYGTCAPITYNAIRDSEARKIKLMKANIESIIDMIESKAFEKKAPFVPCSLRSPDHQSDGSESVQSQD